MAASEENPETLKYQTLALKVFIHCEGCKKTVKKVLHSIDGVYKTCIDSQQQKVVVTGNVEAETLIKKLQKIGKHAELLPDQKKPNEEKAGGGGGGGKKNKSKNKDDNADKLESRNQASSGGADGGSSNASASDKPAEGKKSEPAPPEKQDGAGMKTENAPAAGAIAAGGGSGGGNGKKKGNNKGQNNKKNNKGDGDAAAAGAEAAPQEANQKPAAVGGGAGIPIPPPAFNLPIYTPQMPSYMLSYNSVQPSLSYGGAYYLPTPVHQRGSGAGGIYSAPPGSCYFFSEENANACRIM